jgi:nitroimidazol reductase NimA-like FMN-containing flavoprotein (pyridoxamine 5'-phosphate oxidase superfamily)
MRRKDRQIKDQEIIENVINNSEVCRIAMAKENRPYVIPISFGYDGDAIYFHSAVKGKKIDYFEANNLICFEFEHAVKLLPDDETPCEWSFSFQSVIGYGRISEMLTDEEKIDGLSHIIQQYSGRSWDFSDARLDNLRVWKIEIEEISGKQSDDWKPN